MKNIIETLTNSANCSNTATDLLASDNKHFKQLPSLRTKSQLNKVIVGKNNSPDHLAINIYWDTLRSWYNPQKIYTKEGNILHISKLKTKGVYLNYTKLSKTHGVSKEIIRQKIVKLEGLGLVNRSFQHRETVTTKSFNQLVVYVWQQTVHFFNPYGIDRKEVKELTPQTNHKYISEKYKIDFRPKDTQIEAPIINGVSNQLGDTKELNSLFSLKKSRSMKSTFSKNSFFKKGEGEFRVQTNFITTPPQLKAPVLQLKDFYPLSKSDADYLQTKSGRKFSLNAMNEILLDMSKRVKDRWFKSKKGFLSYMSIVFKHEMRDAGKINNEGFKIRANRTTEEITIQKQEEFLSQIEYSLQVSQEWHLRKKLCAVLEREKAYNLLSSYKHCHLEGNIFEIHLTKHVELTRLDRDIILNQVKATHESINLATGKYVSVSSLKIIAPAPSTDTRSTQEIGQGAVLPAGIWGKIRQALIDYHNYYGKSGEAIDRSWFSKLEAVVDEQKKTVKLKAPTEFIKDWIRNNYAQILERCSRKYQHSYEIC
jgi:hypothetical protein